MDLTITPALLAGSVTPPPSKSEEHRALIAAALADGDSVIENFVPCEDLNATLRAVTALGACADLRGSTLHIRGISPRRAKPTTLPHIDCGESGSTLRFLIPVALAVAGGAVFTGSARLMERPLQPYFDLFHEKGIFYSLDSNTLTVRGELPAGEYCMRGDVSSQFFSGLLFALPLLNTPSVIIPTGRLESSSYILMTLHTLDRFGIHVPATCSLPPQYHIPDNAAYQPQQITAQPDWSQAAFWLAASELGSTVRVCAMDEDSLQGDRVFLEHCRMLREHGAHEIDISDSPDLAPALAVLGALRSGSLRLTNAARLRLKESDRLSAIVQTLAALGADISEQNDCIIIHGKERLRGGTTVDCRNDHRIAMMLAIAATRCEQPVALLGAQCVNKSYPHFWQDYASLGGIIHEHSGQ